MDIEEAKILKMISENMGQLLALSFLFIIGAFVIGLLSPLYSSILIISVIFLCISFLFSGIYIAFKFVLVRMLNRNYSSLRVHDWYSDSDTYDEKVEQSYIKRFIKEVLKI